MAASALVSGAATSPAPHGDGRGLEVLVAELEGDLVELRRRLATFAAAPHEAAARDRVGILVRKLSVEAARLDLPSLAADLSRAEAVVKGAALLGHLSEEDLEQVEATLDDFADALHADREVTPTSGPVHAPTHIAGSGRHTQLISVPALVVGGRPLVELLRARGAAEGDGYAFAVRHVGHVELAQSTLRQAEPRPEVVVVDADEPRAEELVEELLSDPRTESIPLVVVGTWRAPEQAAKFVALGVARCLAKPVPAGELRRACAFVAPGAAPTRHEPLGRLTLDELGARLASELHQSLCDAAVDDRVRRKRVDFGEGSGILTVLWDAVARVRELVSATSSGEVRFLTPRRDEALPTGLSLERGSSAEPHTRALQAVRGGDGEPLAGLTVVVAIEDLSTNWFLCGVLRDAGVAVHDAFGGPEALEVATHTLPDAIVVGLGLTVSPGRTLARALRDDALLRDVPLVLVGPDDAVLRRAEDLGEPCDATLATGVGGELAIQRLREVTRSRASLGERLRDPAPRVRGRLDGLTPTTLLSLVGRARPNSHVTLQSGDAVHEIDLRAGRPLRIARSLADGTVQTGQAALAALFAIGAGRFEIETADQPIADELGASLAELLAAPAGAVRKWHAAVVGAELFRIARIGFDPEVVRGLVEVTPEPARAVLVALFAGRAPRDLLLQGEASQGLVERVLVDLARRQGFVHVDYAPLDLPAVAAPSVAAPAGGESVASSMPTSDAPRLAPAPPPLAARRVSPPAPTALPAAPSFESLLAPEPIESAPEEAWPVRLSSAPSAQPADAPEAFDLAVPDDPAWASPVARVARESGAPSLAEDAVFEPVDDDEAAPRRTSVRVSQPPRAVVEPVVVDRPTRGAQTPVHVPRLAVAPEPTRAGTAPSPKHERRALVVPAAGLPIPRWVEEPQAARPSAPPAPLDSHDAAVADAEFVHAESLHAESLAAPSPAPEAALPAAVSAGVASRVPSMPPLARADVASVVPQRALEPKLADVDLSTTAMPSSFVPRTASSPEPKKPTTRFVVPVLFATLGVSLAVGARWWRYQELARGAAPATPAAQAEVPAAANGTPAARAVGGTPEAPAPADPVPPLDARASAPAAAAAPSEPTSGVEAPADEAPVEVPLSSKEQKRLAADHGLVEIVAGRKDEIFVDGKRVGPGPVQRVSLPGGEERHEVRVKMRGEERVRYVVAKAGVKLRLRVAPPWSR